MFCNAELTDKETKSQRCTDGETCLDFTTGFALIPVIPFFTEIERIRETVETATEVANVLAGRINTG